MTTPDRDIVDRLRFDATRCEMQFSKGVATNIDAAADEIERLRSARPHVILPFTDGSDRDMEPTPEMVEAGADKLMDLLNYRSLWRSAALRARTATEVYKAMEAARRGHQSRTS